MTTALVTGANKGIGLQTVRELAAAGWTVHLAPATRSAAGPPRPAWPATYAH